MIAIAWVNDAETLRTYGSTSDAYAVFSDMLARGNPPDSWDALIAACDATRSADFAKRRAPEKLTSAQPQKSSPKVSPKKR